MALSGCSISKPEVRIQGGGCQSRKYLYLSFYTREQTIPTVICMLLGSGNSVMLSERLHIETGSHIFKMVAAKLEVPVSQLLYKIAKKFQWLPHVFGVGELSCDIEKAPFKIWK
jgi:hypothetical protein